MKFLKNPRFLSCLGLAVMAVLVICFLQPSSREITHDELNRYLSSHSLEAGRATPTPYAGIYRVEGKISKGAEKEKVYITTHLDEAEVKALFDDADVKADIPGSGVR